MATQLACVIFLMCLFSVALPVHVKKKITPLPRQKFHVSAGLHGEFTTVPTVNVRAGALLTIFAADKKTILLSGSGTANCPSQEIFQEKMLILSGPMPRYGPRYLCTYESNLFIVVSDNTINGYYCTPLSSKNGCLRESLWWSVWYKWNSKLKDIGMTADDIRQNRLVSLSAKEYSNLIRLFWRVYYAHSLPAESSAVHGLHGHSSPKSFLTAPRVSRGGGAFGAPVWHGKEDPCVADTLDILYRYANKIPRPCKPIVYDGSGFYVSSPDLLSSTTAGPDCDHTCGFRYYYGSKTRGQIIAFQPNLKDLKNMHTIPNAVLDHA